MFGSCGDDNCSWIIILLILFSCCGDNGFGNGCGCDDNNGSFIWIILLLVLCCGCGDNNRSCRRNDGCC